MKNTSLQIPPACFHLLEELPLQLSFWQYYELYSHLPYSFLLDSAKGSDRLGRFSFMGGEPTMVFKAKRIKAEGGGRKNDGMPHEGNRSSLIAETEIIEFIDSYGRRLDRPKLSSRPAMPFDELRRLLSAYRINYKRYVDHPVPFLGGAVGYFGYESDHFIEELPDQSDDDLGLPDIYLMFVSTVLSHCHRTGRSFLSIIGRGNNVNDARMQAELRRKEVVSKIVSFEASVKTSHSGHSPLSTHTVDANVSNSVESRLGQKIIFPDSADIHSHFDQAKYCRVVESIKEHISAGDVYQVCMTRRLETQMQNGTAWDLYQELRAINPAPFAAFINFPEVRIVSSSPERFLSLDANRIAESRPIKGTRPRGATPAEDNRLRRELADSEKERAENLMIVDLVRNDLGRVCEFGSVNVPEFQEIEEYATLFQLVSTIRGRLAEGRDALDLIHACFPGGSMTGAPKIEAIKIIDQLEPVNRGIYSGAIGYIDFAGLMDLSMVIRTIIVVGDRCYFHVGGGIVADSEPTAEFHETENKAQALIAAIKNLSWPRLIMNAAHDQDRSKLG